MKKPVLLLVDDDRAVLEALEAELMPAFGEIARIEAFGDPRAALDALPSWTDERRPIAVAIVDQKMPAMTGVALLVALRNFGEGGQNPQSQGQPPFAPTRHMRAALLTGYAGLDSAIAARNEAGVLRYLEKPWRGGELAATVRELFRRWIERAEAGTHVVLREVRSETDVEAVLRLRCRVYSGTGRLEALLPGTRTGGIDASPYDLVAHHLGLALRDGREDFWIGAMRITGTVASPATPALQSIGRRHPEVAEALGRQRAEPLPIINDFPMLRALWDRLVALAEQTAEPGKLVLDPGQRSSARTGDRHLARFLIEGAVGHFLHFRTPNAILGCDASHAPFYRPLGFRNVEGEEARPHPRLGFPFVLLHGHMDWIPSPARERCAALAARIARTGRACRCATFPACLGGPYERGDFSAADLFCPARSAELVGLT